MMMMEEEVVRVVVTGCNGVVRCRAPHRQPTLDQRTFIYIIAMGDYETSNDDDTAGITITIDTIKEEHEQTEASLEGLLIFSRFQ